MFLLRLVYLFVCLFVCVSSTLRKKLLTNFYENLGRVRSGPRNNRLDFGGDPDHRLDTAFF